MIYEMGLMERIIMNRKELNVILVSSYLPVGGGISAWTEKYMKYMDYKDIRFELVDLGFVGRRSLYKKYFLDELKRTIRILYTMRKAVKNKEHNIVHINTSCSVLGIHRDYWCLRIARKKRIPVVLHCRCNIEDQLNKNRISIVTFKKMVKNSDLVIVLNNSSIRYVKSLEPRRVELLPNFIESEYCDSRTKNSHSIDEVLFVGHVKKEKGFWELLEVAKEYPKKHFSVIGPPSTEINAEAIPSNVTLFGNLHHDSLKEHYCNADIFLFPSYTEGFSNAMLEAMASGLPIIASDVGSNKDMIEDKGGIIVEPRNSREIIKAMQLLEDEEKRKKCSKWNQEKIITNYTVDAVMEKLINLYIETIQNSHN